MRGKFILLAIVALLAIPIMYVANNRTVYNSKAAETNQLETPDSVRCKSDTECPSGSYCSPNQKCRKGEYSLYQPIYRNYRSLRAIKEDTTHVIVGQVTKRLPSRLIFPEDSEFLGLAATPKPTPGIIVTDFKVRVKSNLWNSDSNALNTSEIVITQLGGRVDNNIANVLGHPLSQVRNNYVFFIGEKTKEGTYHIIGGEQGHYQLVNSKLFRFPYEDGAEPYKLPNIVNNMSLGQFTRDVSKN